MDLKHKKLIRIVLISLATILIIGIGLCCASQCIPYAPLLIPGLIIGGIGMIPLIIISIILFLKQGYM